MATLRIVTNRHGRKFYQLQYIENGQRKRPNIGFVDGPKSITAHAAKVSLDAKNLEETTGQKIFVGQGSVDDSAKEYLAWHAVQFSSNGIPTAHHARVAGIIADALAAQEKRNGQLSTFLGGKRWSQVDRKVMTRWVTWRQQQHTTVRCKKTPENPTGRRTTKKLLAPSTVAKELRHLHAWMEHTRKAGDITSNPCEFVEEPADTRSAVIRYYEPDQLGKLFAQPLHGRHWEWFAVSGLRRQEAQQIPHGDVKLNLREIQVNSTPTQRTKSGKHRIVPMTDDALRVYRELLKATKERFRQLNKRWPTPPELATLPVLPKMAGPSWSRAFRIDRDRLGLPKFAGSLVHALRHCYGTYAIRSDVNPRVLQKLMGHAHLSTTEKYTEPGNKHLHAEGRKIRIGAHPSRKAA